MGSLQALIPQSLHIVVDRSCGIVFKPRIIKSCVEDMRKIPDANQEISQINISDARPESLATGHISKCF